ncbi:hypothetical protein NDU88_001562 [Pleurodeles waltl]|uniref:Uncharacterized protein n=1 Tax=Pleurodeles waltl TaxID=8319 RepID=A0AAV7T093_PLEWA|nr:hypothetical protein NDU88_001562 [Pleurodeles waltl]
MKSGSKQILMDYLKGRIFFKDLERSWDKHGSLEDKLMRKVKPEMEIICRSSLFRGKGWGGGMGDLLYCGSCKAAHPVTLGPVAGARGLASGCSQGLECRPSWVLRPGPVAAGAYDLEREAARRRECWRRAWRRWEKLVSFCRMVRCPALWAGVRVRPRVVGGRRAIGKERHSRAGFGVVWTGDRERRAATPGPLS